MKLKIFKLKFRTVAEKNNGKL